MLKKKITKIHFLSILVIALLAFSPSSNNTDFYGGSGNATLKHLHTDFFKLDAHNMQWVNSKIDSMTLDEKCAQLIMPAAYGGSYINDKEGFERLIYLVKDLKVGGFILKKGDIKNEMSLIDSLQKISKIPLLFSSDFENGLGMRLSDGVEFPSNMALCAAGDPHLAYLMGKAVGKRARLVGVNIDLAPVEDINDNPWNPVINTRAFSDNKDSVTKYSNQFLLGLDDEKVLSVAKHFPGHGNTKIDSHEELPTLEVDKINLLNNDLIPFINSINSGIPGILIGHLSIPSIEPQKKLPSSLSYNVVTGLLKDQLGFKGLIFTDAMDMKAVTDNFTTAEASVKAIEAGNDIVLMPPDENTALSAIVKAVINGEISTERIDESVKKILTVKRWFELNRTDYFDKILFTTGQDRKPVQRLAKEIAEKSITLVKNDENIIPINPEKYYKTACISVTNGSGSRYILPKMIEDNFGYVRSYHLSSNSSKHDYKEALEIVKSANLVIIPSYMGSSDDKDIQEIADRNISFIKKALEINKSAVLLSMNNPYLLSFVPESKTYLCSYGNMPVSQSAMFDAIVGKINISGKLPISIPGTGSAIGDGIEINNFKLASIDSREDTNYDFFEVKDLLREGVEQNQIPGGVLFVGQNNRVIVNFPFGNLSFEKNAASTMKEAMYNLGTASDIVGVESAAMVLADKELLHFDQKLTKFFPYFKSSLTIADLIRHKAVYVMSNFSGEKFNSLDDLLKFISDKNINNVEQTGLKTIDLSQAILKGIIEKVTGTNPQSFLKKNIFEPLNMDRTMYNPPAKYWYYCASLNENSKNLTKHEFDFASVYPGDKGIFSSAENLALFSQLLLQNGRYDQRQYFDRDIQNDWLKLTDHNLSSSFTWINSNFNETKMDNNSRIISSGTDENSGCFWLIDKRKDLFIIFLTDLPQNNRNNYPIFKNRLISSIYKAIDYNF